MCDVISLIISCIKSAASTIKNSSSKAKQGIFAVVAVLGIMASLTFTGTRIAYRVNYSGHAIATISSKGQFYEALSLVASIVEGQNIKEVVDEPVFNTVITLNDNINNTAEVADAIIDNTEDIVKATVLAVDGSVVAIAEKSVLDDLINDRLNQFNIEGAECKSSFVNELSFEEGYFVSSKLDNKMAVEGVVNSLEVVTTARQTTDIIVPYKSIVKNNSEQLVGYSKVIVSGISGVNRVTEDTVMINGVVTSKGDVSTQVVVAAVDEVVEKGSAKTLASAKQKQQAHNLGFAFPLPAGTWQVSAYYGDGRNHKAIDLRAKSGTSIYAVADGTVIQSGWNGNYGYCITIEHDDGTRTLYAHARQLFAKVGARVSQGEVIALVGTTGQSTGNHLHFEVIINGRNVDPAPYINLD